MFRILCFCILFLSISGQLHAQNQNLSKLGQLDYQNLHSSEINDIWGYSDGSGNEYAIIGVNDTGVSIVDVTDPNNPNEVYYSEEIEPTNWRDIKTHDDHAYIVNEGGGGMKIIDLDPLPGNTNLSETTYTAGGMFYTAHNIYIDEDSVAYIFGSDHGNGGAIMLDLSNDPMNPSVLGTYDSRYIHDGMVRKDTLYACHIYDGEFAIVDVTDPNNPQVLGTHPTPKNFAHNAWVSDDGDHLFTTDEKSGGYIGAYDVSDPSNIQELDRIRSTPGSGSIPHNAHFKNDYLITSYYRDGVVIHDVSRPGNMIQVGRYDTEPNLSGDGFDGAWGAYPWLPSGNILASDIGNGLFILSPTYQRGCYLEGTVTDKSDGTPINQAQVRFAVDSLIEESDITGSYASGIGTPGNYDVIYREPAYFPDTARNVPMSRDSLTVRDIQLEPRPRYEVRVEFEHALNGDPIEGAKALLSRWGPDFKDKSGGNGALVLQDVYQGTYKFHGAKWGFLPKCRDSVHIDGPDTLRIALSPGYGDDFALDLGWEVQSNANSGLWERGEPNGTSYQGYPLNPEYDVQGDCGNKAYVTGNQGTSPDDDQVDSLSTILISPKMDLSDQDDAVLSYEAWFVSGSNFGIGDDTMFVSMHGGGRNILLDTVITELPIQWKSRNINLSRYAPFPDSMRVHFLAADPEGNTLTEAGVDRFRLSERPLSLKDDDQEKARVEAMPNPFDEELNIRWEGRGRVNYELYGIDGKMMRSGTLQGGKGRISGGELPAGVYILNIKDANSDKPIARKRIVRKP